VGNNFPVIVNHLRSLIDVSATTTAGENPRSKRRAQAEFLANLKFNDGYVDVLGTVRGVPTHGQLGDLGE